MISASPPILVHLNTHGQGVITCPQCSKQSQICATTYRDLHAPVRVSCPCGSRFAVLFNTRDYYRKDVHLAGTYTSLGKTSKRRMTVVNLSMTGVRFYTLLPNTLQVNDVVELMFCLDDHQQTEICHEVTIHWVDDKHIGASFCDLQAYERKLGFYLRPG